MKQLLANLGLLVLRLTGVLLAFHGFGKVFAGPEGASFLDHLGHFENTRFVRKVHELGLPFPIVAAWLAALSELVGGAFVAIGIYPRVAAGFAAATMGVAVFMAHAGDGLDAREHALLFLLPMAAVALLGGGEWRADRAWRGKAD